MYHKKFIVFLSRNNSYWDANLLKLLMFYFHSVIYEIASFFRLGLLG